MLIANVLYRYGSLCIFIRTMLNISVRTAWLPLLCVRGPLLTLAYPQKLVDKHFDCILHLLFLRANSLTAQALRIFLPSFCQRDCDAAGSRFYFKQDSLCFIWWTVDLLTDFPKEKSPNNSTYKGEGQVKIFKCFINFIKNFLNCRKHLSIFYNP